MSIPLLHSSMECSSNNSSSPPGRTGITHLGLEINSSNLVSFAVGKLSTSSWSVWGAGGLGAATGGEGGSDGGAFGILAFCGPQPPWAGGEGDPSVGSPTPDTVIVT